MDRPTSSIPLRLCLLGGFCATRAGKSIADTEWRRLTSRSLVKLLAVHPGHRLHRDQIIDSIWPELDAIAAIANFRNALHRARHTLEPELPPKATSSYLLLSDEVLSFSRLVVVDADQFEFLARRALTTEDVSSYEAALSHYGGELLPEDRYLDWASARRYLLATLHHRLLVTLAGILERRGAHESAVERLEQALLADATREEVHRSLMRLYTTMGRQHDALRQYQRCITVMREELDASPEPETVELHERLLTMKVITVEADREQRVLLPRAVARTPTTPYVGREDAVDLLVTALDAASAGRGDTVLLGGDAGIGKSRLAAEAAREAERRGTLVLWGASHENAGLLSYGPIVDAFEGYVTQLPDEEQRALAERHVTLARLLPSLSRYVDPGVTPRSTEQLDGRHLFAAMAALLAALATVRPILLVLDDLHLADTASLDLLASLARSAPEHRWLLLGLYRDEEVAAGSKLYRLGMEIAREGIGQRLSLRRLQRMESDQLVRALLGDEPVEEQVLDRIFDLSFGNPLFAQELISSLREQGFLYLRDGSWHCQPVADVDVPLQVRELIEVRLEGLEDEDLLALGLAAVAGGEFTYALLLACWQAMVGEPREGALLNRLDRGLRVGILEERDGHYAFRHPLYQATLYGRLSQHRRAAFHAAMAHSIQHSRPEEVEILAHHYRRAGELGPAAVYLERAGDRAQRVYAGASAEAHFRDALAILDSSQRSQDGARVRLKLGLVLILMSRYDDALIVLEQAVAAYIDGNDQNGLVGALGQIGLAHFHRGTVQEGLARLQPFLGHLDQPRPTVDAAVLYLALSHLYFASGRYYEQLAASTRASALADAMGEATIRAQAEIRRGTALLMVGDASSGRRVLEGAIPLAEAVGDLDGLSRTLNNLAYSYLIGGQLYRHLDFAQRALVVMQRVGDPVRTALYQASVGQAWFFLGEWGRARELIELGVAALQDLPPSWHAAYPLFFLGLLRFQEGNWEEAWRLFEESNDIGQRGQDMQVLRSTSMYLAEIELLQGSPHAACDRLIPFAGDPENQAQGSVDLDQLFTISILAWAEVERGDPERAEKVILPAIRQVAGENLGLFRGVVVAVYGVVLTALERWQEAEETLNEALALARGMPYPFLEAEALRFQSRLHSRHGNEVAARECIAEASRIFHRLGADGYAARVGLNQENAHSHR